MDKIQLSDARRRLADIIYYTRYFDLQGREVNAGTKGLVIRKQGNEVKKVVVR